MNSLLNPASATAALEALTLACGKLAPTWPLDRFIAVNPFWELVGTPMQHVAARLAALSGAHLLMPRAWYREQHKAGRFGAAHLKRAIDERGADVTLSQLEHLLNRDEAAPQVRARVMDVADQGEDASHLRPGWREFITSSLSQFCASYFDDGQASLRPSHAEGLYATWRRHSLADRSPARLMGVGDFEKILRLIPPNVDEMALLALAELEVPGEEIDAWLHGLLLDLNGWASWCAYLGWTARLRGETDSHLRELLVIRLTWEWILLRLGGPKRRLAWKTAIRSWASCDAHAAASTEHDWLVQRALELAFQDEVKSRLQLKAEVSRSPCALQAVFCIDVRSEVFRRALEAQAKDVTTLGFAGFFGLPIEYQPTGTSAVRPQLPGLLAPRLAVRDVGLPDELHAARRSWLSSKDLSERLKTSAVSAYSFVESFGPLAAAALVSETFGRPASTSVDAAGLSDAQNAARRPRLFGLEVSARTDLAAGVLGAMSLKSGFARLVALIGHGSQTRNNPHAAGLDCGACGGQTGEVNARATAALLNDAEVRAALASRGLMIPDTTRFVCALHDTTTDEVTVFEAEEVPASHQADLARFRDLVAAAGRTARRERAAKLNLPVQPDRATDAELLAAVQLRARDWAQVRPEWGLAGNAAFIVGPRSLTRGADLGGQAFLHDYCWETDEGFKVLELIMTAPMVVAHWINAQYNASTVDNLRYGSGNKVLHNVVGGHLGVFEGNGGDLRIGLSKQSLHDGEHWVHSPRRLSVFIAAPRRAIDDVLERHERVRALVENEWLFLFEVSETTGELQLRRGKGWQRYPGSVDDRA